MGIGSEKSVGVMVRDSMLQYNHCIYQVPVTCRLPCNHEGSVHAPHDRRGRLMVVLSIDTGVVAFNICH